MTVALVSRYLRWGVLLSATTAAAVYLIVAVPLAIPSGLTSVPAALAGVRDAVFGVVVGWKQILTLKPPLGEYQAVLVPFLLVMFFGAFAATLLVTHRGRRAVLAPVVLSAMSVFGIAFGLIGTSAPVSILGFRFPPRGSGCWASRCSSRHSSGLLAAPGCAAPVLCAPLRRTTCRAARRRRGRISDAICFLPPC